MRTSTIVFRCFSLASVVLASYLWLRIGGSGAKFGWPLRPFGISQGTKVTDRRPDVSGLAGIPSEIDADTILRTSLDQVPAAIRQNLDQWLKTNTGESDTQDAITKKLLSLLRDDNVAEIVQALSLEELNTPFATVALKRWLNIDAWQAACWLATQPDASGEHALLVARRMLENPVELSSYCELLPDNTWKQNVLNCASREAISKDPVTAIAFAQRIRIGDVQTNALETIAYDWFGRDLDAAVNWTNTIEDPLLREKLLAVGAKAIAIADPDLSASWLGALGKTDGVLNETSLTVVDLWAAQSPQQAAGWVSHFPLGSVRETAAELILRKWLQTDTNAAEAWLASLPDYAKIAARLEPVPDSDE